MKITFEINQFININFILSEYPPLSKRFSNWCIYIAVLDDRTGAYLKSRTTQSNLFHSKYKNSVMFSYPYVISTGLFSYFHR